MSMPLTQLKRGLTACALGLRTAHQDLDSAKAVLLSGKTQKPQPPPFFFSLSLSLSLTLRVYLIDGTV